MMSPLPRPQGRARRINTPRRRALLDALDATDAFLSAPEIHALVRTQLAGGGLRIGISTIYRLLAQLTDDDRVDVRRAAHRETLYRLRRRREHHHSYLICRACGRAVELAGDAIDAWAERLGSDHGFTGISTASVELSGLCHRCRAAGGAQ